VRITAGFETSVSQSERRVCHFLQIPAALQRQLRRVAAIGAAVVIVVVMAFALRRRTGR
jgi:hypothetical protein